MPNEFQTVSNKVKIAMTKLAFEGSELLFN